MPAVDHCLTRFEESLKETMALRRSCEEASLQDCCQVRYYYPLALYNYTNSLCMGELQIYTTVTYYMIMPRCACACKRGIR